MVKDEKTLLVGAKPVAIFGLRGDPMEWYAADIVHYNVKRRGQSCCSLEDGAAGIVNDGSEMVCQMKGTVGLNAPLMIQA
ncbi:hypothetical protein RchiOBHm_Chr4g0417541 [Rosa chinensis]|uniref:Uncharacterized protein n=1 Tax=Rosa chinensis TaxID=74649 RepID=A0A2P6QX49_ROSCH|nr:hypothetical protein RchiOBHm_Chr4g0417541 [Rosa chinensis]